MIVHLRIDMSVQYSFCQCYHSTMALYVNLIVQYKIQKQKQHYLREINNHGDYSINFVYLVIFFFNLSMIRTTIKRNKFYCRSDAINRMNCFEDLITAFI